MKKILISVVLAVISLIIGTFSFIINDLPSYHRWMADNGPKMMETFDRWNKDRKDNRKGPDNEKMKDDMKGHHDRNTMGQDRRNMPDNRQGAPGNMREAPGNMPETSDKNN
jgi:hypothetical protein|nr:hypothetical protein [uncultured Dialister sp.]